MTDSVYFVRNGRAAWDWCDVVMVKPGGLQTVVRMRCNETSVDQPNFYIDCDAAEVIAAWKLWCEGQAKR